MLNGVRRIDHDVYVTVTNVGYQWTGTWFGQLAWYDFYNTSFELPEGYYDSNGNVSSKYSSFPDYAYQDYEPRVYQPTTYRLPAGEYFWVIGGTSEDAYRHINVDDSANQYVNPVRCANGNVKFTVTGGEVTGTMYCYTDAEQVAEEPDALGYVASGYALQYSGIADRSSFSVTRILRIHCPCFSGAAPLIKPVREAPSGVRIST